MKCIRSNYNKFYNSQNHTFLYPTEFVVRIFLANYQGMSFQKPKSGSKILDLGCGDGRNTAFLCQQKLDVYGIEITREIVDKTDFRLKQLGWSANLSVGDNQNIPFDDRFFEYVLACHSMYYCLDGSKFEDNLFEYLRVMKPGAWLIASIANEDSLLFKNSTKTERGTFIINNDPYNNRNGTELFAVKSYDEIEEKFSPHFENFSFGSSKCSYFGHSDESVFWVTCQKKILES
jgi:ubiquinone/menaquinone biosynthesis C-methylase UbiE